MSMDDSYGRALRCDNAGLFLFFACNCWEILYSGNHQTKTFMHIAIKQVLIVLGSIVVLFFLLVSAFGGISLISLGHKRVSVILVLFSRGFSTGQLESEMDGFPSSIDHPPKW